MEKNNVIAWKHHDILRANLSCFHKLHEHMLTMAYSQQF